MAEILHVFTAVEKGKPVREVEESVVLENKGLEHCIHGLPESRRQVLLMDIETLEQFGVAPGRVKENLTTRGIVLRELAAGQRLRAGSALLEVTLACEPCRQMDMIRMGLRDVLRGRRGMLCRVIRTGVVRRGDALEAVSAENAELQSPPASGRRACIGAELNSYAKAFLGGEDE